MVKSRMNPLDVRASVLEMESALVGLRLLNIYDLSASMFLLKFGHGENKKMVLIENGVRMHLTELSREIPRQPSQFTLKLRKHVRSWRLGSIAQLHQDRTVDMCFGVAGSESCFHVIVELFAKGNIILTDHTYTILMLLHMHKDKNVQLVVRGVYPVEEEAAASCSPAPTTTTTTTSTSSADSLAKEWAGIIARAPEHETLKGLLAALRHLGQSFAEHILARTQVTNARKRDLVASSADPDSLPEVFEKLLPAVQEALELARRPLDPGGFLISREGAASGPEGAPPYEDFTPLLLAQHPAPTAASGVVFRGGFGELCDAFFRRREDERIDLHNEKNDGVVRGKRERFAADHQRRLDHLQAEAARHRAAGERVLLQAARVDGALGMINGVRAAGVPWEAILALLRRRRAEGHPLARLVHGLDLARNAATVLLGPEPADEDDDAAPDADAMAVELDLAKGAHANAAVYFAREKASLEKRARTVAATAKAAAGAARKADRVAARQQTRKALVRARRRGWWEGLFWCLTAAGDVVLRGRDRQTTERLVRQVMRAGDFFVHCDRAGALPCILRPMHAVWRAGETREGRQPVSARSLAEAGGWCVSRSAAWEQKQTIGAWWVYASQITGGDAAGGYAFDGEKHHIPPQPLALGVGLLFRITRDGAAPAEADDDTHTEKKKEAAVGWQGAPLLDVAAGTAWTDYIPADEADGLRTLTGPPPRAAAGASRAGPQTAARSPPAARGPLTKRQLRKLQKIHAKYGDQDDEDRRLGAMLNGNALARVQRAELAEVRAAAKEGRAPEEEEEEEKGEEGSLSDLKEGSEFTGESALEDSEGIPAAAEPGEVEGEAGEGGEKVSMGSENVRKGVDDNTADARDAELKKAILLYTSRPTETDVVEYAVAVCAPFAALINYAFRIELSCVMNNKKGQVSNNILQAFKERIQPPEKEGPNKAKKSARGKGKNGAASALPPLPAIPTKNESLLRALESLEPNELLEQLRANVKPLHLQAK